MMDNQNNITQLKDSGLKVTGPRLKILDLFEKNPDAHLSAEDVYRLLLEENIDIGVATIYRVLTQFEQSEILVRHHFETGKAVYELNRGGHHDHIVCVKCSKVTEFYDSQIEELQDRIAQANGYEIIDHAMYMYGVCQDCQSKPGKKTFHR
jgi:Fur family ferric uptake transcriptional regulator